ncbi:MAG: hypothetical protein N3E36_05550 [Sulfolobales archaeon]|nr:hypothetical protein [Sulfolobales archaeon]
MRVAELNSLDVKACKYNIFSTIKEGNITRLVRLNPNLEVVDEIASFKGLKAFILKAEKPFLISVDDRLIFVEEGFQKKVLTASAPENFFLALHRSPGACFHSGIWLFFHGHLHFQGS